MLKNSVGHMDNKALYESKYGISMMRRTNWPAHIKEWLGAEELIIRGKIRKGATVIDVACGDGRYFPILAPISRKVIGIDYSNLMISEAQRNIRNLDSENVEVQKANALNLPFEENQFDYALCTFNSLSYLPKEKQTQALKEMARVVKNGGRIYFGVWAENAAKSQRGFFENKLGLKFVRNVIDRIMLKTPRGEWFISKRYSKADLSELFANAGLNVRILKPHSVGYLCEATVLK